MPTTTHQDEVRSIEFRSGDHSKLLGALQLYFDEREGYTLCWRVDGDGFHVEAHDDRKRYSETRWEHSTSAGPHLPIIAEAISAWLRELSPAERLRLSKRKFRQPASSYSRVGRRLKGYELRGITLGRSGRHSIGGDRPKSLTVTVAWV